jgi:fatty acid desaturase
MNTPQAAWRTVRWRDLVDLTWVQRMHELTVCVPWLVVSLAFYQYGWIIPGMAGSFLFFLTGLRLSHNAQHRALGIGRFGHDLVLLVLSVLMFSSMHAVRVTHLHHHRHCLDQEDFEARHITQSWWRVLLLGWMFPFQLHATAWRLGKPKDRRWMVAELILLGSWVGIVLMGLGATALTWHLLAMVTGQCFTSFFAVWIVHRGCHEHGPIARTQRGRIKNVVSYAMFYHLEHHLFPAVPTCRLCVLAKRMDRVDPNLSRLNVF